MSPSCPCSPPNSGQTLRDLAPTLPGSPPRLHPRSHPRCWSQRSPRRPRRSPRSHHRPPLRPHRRHPPHRRPRPRTPGGVRPFSDHRHIPSAPPDSPLASFWEGTSHRLRLQGSPAGLGVRTSQFGRALAFLQRMGREKGSATRPREPSQAPPKPPGPHTHTGDVFSICCSILWRQALERKKRWQGLACYPQMPAD